ncbi:MAG: DNA mismatch repair endonuclease MutH [Gammaproteobacteria bacterium]|nr:DNA mismatch repair endonuclease MutH [Gammaproteobacteria bacterium]
MNIPEDEAALIKRALCLAGRTLGEIAQELHLPVPKNITHAKGWTGQLIEKILGASAGSLAEPDFPHLGIELKTLPISSMGVVSETTYVCIVPLSEMNQATWKTSIVYAKLAHVLWVPIDITSPTLFHRRIGTPLLCDLPENDEALLQKDWEEFAELISLGKIESITAHQGTVLQIRPKAAHSRIKTAGIGPLGEPIQTLPRGFYLRKCFTQKIIKRYFVV